MARLTIYKDDYADSTAVSNRFIDEYMKDANDAQLKVYLYLVRMLNANLATSVSDIADKFNHTEKDVIRALKYWEKQKLLDLDYDEDKNLTGIHMRELKGTGTQKSDESPGTFSKQAPVSSPLSLALSLLLRRSHLLRFSERVFPRLPEVPRQQILSDWRSPQFPHELPDTRHHQSYCMYEPPPHSQSLSGFSS